MAPDMVWGHGAERIAEHDIYAINERLQCGLQPQHLTDRAKVRIGPTVLKNSKIEYSGFSENRML